MNEKEEVPSILEAIAILSPFVGLGLLLMFFGLNSLKSTPEGQRIIETLEQSREAMSGFGIFIVSTCSLALGVGILLFIGLLFLAVIQENLKAPKPTEGDNG